MTVVTTTLEGYLESTYLDGPYLLTIAGGNFGVQFEAQILDKQNATGVQSALTINDVESPFGAQSELTLNKQANSGVQYNGQILDFENAIGAQYEGVINAQNAIGSQYSGSILNKLVPIGTQSQIEVSETSPFGVQGEAILTKADARGTQFEGVLSKLDPLGAQFNGDIQVSAKIGTQFVGELNKQSQIGAQYSAVLSKQPATGVQFQSEIINLVPIGTQSKGALSKQDPLAVEFIQDTLLHVICEAGGYLETEYLEGSYLTDRVCAIFPVQFHATIENRQHPEGVQYTHVNPAASEFGAQSTLTLNKQANAGVQYEGFIIDREHAQGTQFQGVIEARVPFGSQYEGTIVDKLDEFGVQLKQIRAFKLGVQFTAVLYNVTNLRVLCHFPSRGLTGTNWSASTTEPGDFSVNNLNTDIVEQYWRGEDGILSVTLDCDTEIPQGVFTDTVGILGHNMTTSANIQLQGSNSPTFASVGVAHVLTPTPENIYFVTDELPLAGFRYWRFVIDDPTNPDGFIKIGTIVFGNAIIFHGECFIDRVTRGQTHYKNQIFTEGHTNVMLDRGLKKRVSLEFQSIEFGGGNFRNMSNLFNYSRTHLKCLWIPIPKSYVGKTLVNTASRFAVFAKMENIPEETHNFKNAENDHVNFRIDLDESL